MKFRINGTTIDAQNFWNGHFTAWWTPPAYGNYSIEIQSANNFGAVKTESVSVNIVPESEDTEAIAFSNVWLNPNSYTEVVEAELPSFLGAFDQIIGTLNVHCPSGGCGEWDRVASVEAKNKEGNWIEIMRYITPYGVACSHSIDLTDYMSNTSGQNSLQGNLCHTR